MNTREAGIAYGRLRNELSHGGARSDLPNSSPSGVSLSQHPDEHRPKRPVLLAVGQQLSESAALRVAPELSDPVGALEVGQLQDVEQLGTGSGAERVEARPQPTLDLTGTHGWRLRGRTVASVSGDWLIKTIRMGSPQHQSLMLQRAA
jgi:hypothetical protein